MKREDMVAVILTATIWALFALTFVHLATPDERTTTVRTEDGCFLVYEASASLGGINIPIFHQTGEYYETSCILIDMMEAEYHNN